MITKLAKYTRINTILEKVSKIMGRGFSAILKKALTAFQ
jgi:hypothetical protein